MANNNGKQLLVGMLMGVSLLGSVPALAAKDAVSTDLGAQGSGLYIGGAIGRSHFPDLSNLCNSTLPNAGATVSSCKNNATSWKGFVGYRFVRYFGVEVGYYDFGKGKATVSSPGAGDVTWKAHGPAATAVATVPIIGGLSFLARAGAIRYQTKLEVDGGTGLGIPNGDDHGVSGLYGLGLEYMFTDTFGIRGEYERTGPVGTDTNTARSAINMWSLSGLIRF